METDFSFEIDGRTYRQNFLPAAKALRLHHKIVKLGFIPVGQALQQHLSNGGSISDLLPQGDQVSEVGELMLTTFYNAIQTLEPEDVEGVYKVLAESTFIATSDGRSEQRLDAANHFVDARDMLRMYEFLVFSIREQLRPFFRDLRTKYSGRLQKSTSPTPQG